MCFTAPCLDLSYFSIIIAISQRNFLKGTHEVCPIEEAERDFHDLAYDVQHRERVESKARPDRAAQASWTNRAHPKAHDAEPPPKARPMEAPEPVPEPAPKPAPKPAAETIDADDDSWGDWPKGKHWCKKQRKRERKQEAEAEERRIQELRDKRIAQELADEQALGPDARHYVYFKFHSSSDPDSKWHCSICMSEVDVGESQVILPCFHMFHHSCALAWFNEGSITCPT